MKPPRIGPEHAVFLDIDGTLIDLAPTPDAVVVPAELPGTLRTLRARLGGAVAVISGRKMSDIDRLIGPDFAAAAEHGGILRDAAGVVTYTARRPVKYDEWLEVLQARAAAMPGVLIEVKEFNLVVHYRLAPEREGQVRRLVEALVAGADDMTLLPAHRAFELKARGGDKGTALAAFMREPPFAGRVPVFVGDDVTDEPAIAQAVALGGAGLHVGRDFAGETRAVREWLDR